MLVLTVILQLCNNLQISLSKNDKKFLTLLFSDMNADAGQIMVKDAYIKRVMIACHNHLSTNLIKSQAKYIEKRLDKTATIAYDCYRLIYRVLREKNEVLLNRNLKSSIKSLLKQRELLDRCNTRIKRSKKWELK
jgi:hypothetical protein